MKSLFIELSNKMEEIYKTIQQLCALFDPECIYFRIAVAVERSAEAKTYIAALAIIEILSRQRNRDHCPKNGGANNCTNERCGDDHCINHKCNCDNAAPDKHLATLRTILEQLLLEQSAGCKGSPAQGGDASERSLRSGAD